jgi:hypothetical protein
MLALTVVLAVNTTPVPPGSENQPPNR